MCHTPQTANESDLQFLVKITGVTQLESRNCGQCDVPLVRPVIADDTTEAEHVGLCTTITNGTCAGNVEDERNLISAACMLGISRRTDIWETRIATQVIVGRHGH